MSTRDIQIDIPVDGQHIAGTLVGPDTMVPGVMLVHGWDGSQDQYIARAHEIAALGCICLTFDLRGHVRHQGLRESVSREDNLRDVLAAYDVLVGHPAVDPGAIAIVGSSYGGYLAAIASALRPVRWLALRAPALYKDADWDMPKGKLNRDELIAYRNSRGAAQRQSRARRLRGVSWRRADRRVGARFDGAASGDSKLHERLRTSPVAHLPDDLGRGPRPVRRALAANLYLVARQLDE